MKIASMTSSYGRVLLGAQNVHFAQKIPPRLLAYKRTICFCLAKTVYLLSCTSSFPFKLWWLPWRSLHFTSLSKLCSFYLFYVSVYYYFLEQHWAGELTNWLNKGSSGETNRLWNLSPSQRLCTFIQNYFKNPKTLLTHSTKNMLFRSSVEADNPLYWNISLPKS